MDLHKRFTFGEIVHKGGIQTSLARDIVSGRNVLIHIASGRESASPLRFLDSLNPEARQVILEHGQDQNAGYAITPDLPPLRTFADWVLENLGSLSPAHPPLAAAENLANTDAPGEFTRLFQVPASNRPEVANPVRATPSTVNAPGKSDPPLRALEIHSGPVPARVAEPGEFTRLMQGVAPETPSPAVSKSNPPLRALEIHSGPVPTPTAELDEFTRAMQGVAPETQSPAVSKSNPPLRAEEIPTGIMPAGTAEADAFTRLMQGVAPETPSPAVSKPNPPLRAEEIPTGVMPAPVAKPGEFTRVMQSVFKDSRQPARPSNGPPATGAKPDEATKLFPLTAVPGDSSPMTAPSPGEFTQKFQARTSPEQPPRDVSDPSRSSSHSAASQPGEMSGLFESASRAPGVQRPPAWNTEFGSDLPNSFDSLADGHDMASGPAPLPKRAEPGTFTQFFHSPWEAGTLPTPDPINRASAIDPRPRNDPPKSTDSPGATAVFWRPEGMPAQSAKTESEFTRVLAAPSANLSQAQQVPVMAPSPSVSGKEKDISKTMWISIFAILFVLAVALIVYFAVHR